MSIQDFISKKMEQTELAPPVTPTAKVASAALIRLYKTASALYITSDKLTVYDAVMAAEAAMGLSHQVPRILKVGRIILRAPVDFAHILAEGTR